MSQVAGVNNFVVRFANVNGTGSASANGLVAKSFFRMGLPIGPKNMFPSNIQGLPTWFEVRVSEQGYTGRRGGVDVMVAMNPQTLASDVAALSPGGYLVYDSTKPLPEALRRKDITELPVPLAEMCIGAFSNPKQRPMLKNVVYVGALTALLNIDYEVVRTLISDQYAAKPKLLETNFQAFDLGYRYAKEAFTCPLPVRVERRSLVGERILIDGNQAAGLGCVYAGATVAAWYPITPSTSLVDSFQRYCRRFRGGEAGNRYGIVQAEDELSAIGMVLGATWNGARAFTATSGPGVSLMNEFLGFAYYAEVPVVLFNVQRCGPSTGMPTRTQQADILLCAYASHGDTKHVLLFPANPNECFEFAVKAFDLADRLQTPVIVLSDLDIGMNEWLSEPLTWDDRYRWDRGKVLDAQALDGSKTAFSRYLDSDGDAIPYRTYPGTHPQKGAYFTRGSGHDKWGRYTEDAALYQENVDRLARKFKTAASYVPPPIVRRRHGAKAGVIYVGSSAEALDEALACLEGRGIALDAMRIRAFPFTADVEAFVREHERLFVVEQNRDGQLRGLLAMEAGIDPSRMQSVLCYDGMPMTASGLVETLESRAKAKM